ncbi:MAG TPA: hypothetical protein DCS93_39775 [Microscillaceae bacterium]|nr:hypothetical protein [Microscillaceae bacterium]
MKNLFILKLLLLACLTTFSTQAQDKKQPTPKNATRNTKKRPTQRRQMPAIGKVYGVVKDAESGKPIEFATVALYNVRTKKVVTGAIANAKGKFSISEIKLGMYEVKINYIGYKVKTVGPIRLFPKQYRGQGVEQNLGDVKIEATAAKLEAVTVTAEREDIEIKADRKVFNVEKNITSTGGTALEALQNVPSIDVDQDGNVSLRGSANVTVFIDGKPSGLTGGGRQAALEQIPASSIKKIEVITNPSAKYDPDGMSGIINIVLKKNVLRGLNGFANVSVGTNDKYSGSLRLNLRTGKINTYVTYSGNYFNRFSNGVSDQLNFNGDTATQILQVNDGDIRFYSQLLKAGIDINLDEKNELSVSALYSLRGFGRDQISDQSLGQRIGTGAITPLSLTLQDNELGSTGDNMDFNVGYKRYFNNPDKLLSFDVRHSRSQSLFTSDLIVQPLDITNRTPNGTSTLTLNETDNQFNITTAQVDFELPLTKALKLEMGAKTTIRNIFNGFSVSEDATGTGDNLVPDLTQNNDFRYDEYVYAAYAIYNHQLSKKLSFQAGIRVEQTMSEAVVENTDQRFDNEFLNVFPSGFITYKVTKNGTFAANYSRRINRPRTRALNPFLIRINTNNFYQGNPGLLPEFINSYEVSYTHTWKGTTLNVSSYFRDIRGSIQRFRIIDPITNITTSTFDNIASGRNYGVELIYNMKPAKWFNFTLSGNFYRTEIDGSNVEEGDLNNDAYSYQTKLLLNFKASSKLNFQVTSNYRAPIALAQGELEEVYATDAAVNYKILKGKGTLGFRVSDIFNSRRFGFNTDGGNFIQVTDFKPETRIAFLTFSYRFGKISMDARKMRQMRKKRKNRRRRRGDNVPNVDGMN